MFIDTTGPVLLINIGPRQVTQSLSVPPLTWKQPVWMALISLKIKADLVWLLNYTLSSVAGVAVGWCSVSIMASLWAAVSMQSVSDMDVGVQLTGFLLQTLSSVV